MSTAASRVAMGLVLLGLFLSRHRYTVYRRAFLAKRTSKADFVMLNRMGWPVALQMGMETASFSLSVVMVGWIGTMALTAHQILLTISQLFFMIYYGLAAAVAVRVSLFKGQGDLVAVRRAASSGFHLTLIVAACGVTLLFAAGGSLVRLFTSDVAVCALVVQVFLPMAVYQFGDGLQCTFANSLRGIARVKPMMYIAFFAYFIVSLPLGYLFGITLGFGLTGIWFAFPFGLTTAGVLYYVWFVKATRI